MLTDFRATPGGHVALPAALLLALATSFFALGGKPLWYDEALSFYFSHDGLGQTIFYVAKDTHPPLYYLVLSLVLDLATSPFAMRLVSALAMVGATGFVYGGAANLFGRRVALLAAVLFALNPQLVDFAQKARPYALQTFFVALAFWGTAQVIRAEPAGRKRPFFAWLAIAAGGAAAMLTQHPAGFFLLAINLAALLRLIVLGKQASRWFLRWIAAQIVLVLIWMLWLPGFLEQMGNLISANWPPDSDKRYWVYFIDGSTLRAILLELYGVSSLWRARFVAWALYAMALGFGLVALRRQGAVVAGTVLLPAFLPMILGVLGFAFLHPIFGYVISTMHWMLVPYVMIIALGLCAIPSRILSAAAIAAVLLLNLWGLRNYYQTPNPPLDALTQSLEREVLPGDGIIFSRTGVPRFAVAYYLRGSGKSLAGLDASRDGTDLIRTAEAARQNPRDWIVLAQGQPSAVDLDALGGTPAFRQNFGPFTLLRIDRAAR